MSKLTGTGEMSNFICGFLLGGGINFLQDIIVEPLGGLDE